MSSNCIKLGKWNNAYKYLFLSVIFALLKDVFLGASNEAIFGTLKILDSGDISNCFLIREAFCYLVTVILAFLLYKRYINDEFKHSTQESENHNLLEENLTGSIKLIHYEQNMTNYPIKKLLFIIFLWVVEEEFLSYFKNVMLHLDFWMLELIVVHFFMIKILKMEVYEHQRLMLWFCIIPFILKLITILLSFIDSNNRLGEKDEFKYDGVDKLKIIYVAVSWLLPVGLVIYFILIIFRSYVNTKIKWLIDLKYISSTKIFILYSLTGFIFCALISIIATFIPCNSSNEEGFYTFKDYFCTVHYSNKKYLDNLKLYFGYFDKNGESIYEIIAIFSGVFFFRFL